MDKTPYTYDIAVKFPNGKEDILYGMDLPNPLSIEDVIFVHCKSYNRPIELGTVDNISHRVSFTKFPSTSMAIVKRSEDMDEVYKKFSQEYHMDHEALSPID